MQLGVVIWEIMTVSGGGCVLCSRSNPLAFLLQHCEIPYPGMGNQEVLERG